MIWDVGGLSWLLCVVSIKDALYFLPLALGWEVDEDHVRALAPLTVARIRQQANVGLLGDAIADEGFCRHVVKAICAGRSVPTGRGALRFVRGGACPELSAEELAEPAARRAAYAEHQLLGPAQRPLLPQVLPPHARRA